MTGLDLLLARLAEDDVRLTAAGDVLRYDAPAGVLTPRLLDELRAHKPALLARLSGVVDEAPASAQQEAMLAAVAQAGRPQVWNVPTRIGLRGKLDVTALGTALAELTARHESLRCRFVSDSDGRYRQQVLPPKPCPLSVDDLRDLPEPSDRDEQICRSLADTPFDLAVSTEPVCRLLRLADQEWALMLVLHHISVDGWALNVVLTELAELYRAAATGGPSRLKPPGAQATGYARWLEQHRDPVREARAIEFWRARFAQVPFGLVVRADRPRPERPSGDGGTARLTVPATTRAAVEAFARRRDTTPFAVAAATLGAYLTGTAGGTVVLSVSYANRERAEFESLVSCTRLGVGLAVTVDGRESFGELVDRTTVEIRTVLDNPVPMTEVLRALRESGRTDVPAGLSYGIAFQNFQPAALDFPDLVSTVRDVAAAAARVELVFGIVPCADPAEGYQAWLEYSADRWDPASADAVLAGYVRALNELAAEPARLSRG
ncbi:condensation domain-containing protein [Kutzneria buriramensis]|uniref:Condensation domain-containing protein n=1 Tax=Kutzneria buriramensis TaxID=1045776 RepID=A0A3E0HKL4_9PSEU|nr:condensation domain-containing protein [Kutzneria buriramensis]REH46880.1 condensation domain-containing protein [Kutzneria buriramensis]